MERSKKKVQLWKKAIFHFLLCFVMGFFTGIAPMGKSSMQVLSSSGMTSEVSPQPVEMSVQNFNESSFAQTPVEVAMPMHTQELADKKDQEKDERDTSPKRLIIIVTPTSAKDQLRELLLSKLANTLKLVPPPLLWIVVEQQSESSQVSEILRKTGVMYRHLVFTETFSNLEAEMDYQKNVALNHMEHHKLSGIVHFAGLSNVYDLSFFNEIRTIEVFGTWPMALVSANRKRVTIEGPVCNSAQVIGWHLRRMNNNNATEEDAKSPLHISSFAFNSSILWDPERWGRVSSVQDTSQEAPWVVGCAVAAAAYAGRYSILAWNAFKARPPRLRRFYEGGFQSTMTRREAALILGVRERSPTDKIREAHRRVMVANHPDAGGSHYLASKINEAKEMMFGKVKGSGSAF